MPFLSAKWNEAASSKNWTYGAESISNDGDHYTKRAILYDEMRCVKKSIKGVWTKTKENKT